MEKLPEMVISVSSPGKTMDGHFKWEGKKSNIRVKWEEKLHAEQEKAFIGQETYVA